MQRLTKEQRARIEQAGQRRGDDLRRLRLSAVALRRGGAPHPRSGVDGLPVVRRRRPPQRSLPVLHYPPRLGRPSAPRRRVLFTRVRIM